MNVILVFYIFCYGFGVCIEFLKDVIVNWIFDCFVGILVNYKMFYMGWCIVGVWNFCFELYGNIEGMKV